VCSPGSCQAGAADHNERDVTDRWHCGARRHEVHADDCALSCVRAAGRRHDEGRPARVGQRCRLCPKAPRGRRCADGGSAGSCLSEAQRPTTLTGSSLTVSRASRAMRSFATGPGSTAAAVIRSPQSSRTWGGVCLGALRRGGRTCILSRPTSTSPPTILGRLASTPCATGWSSRCWSALLSAPSTIARAGVRAPNPVG
jgi:hypothetical protein